MGRSKQKDRAYITTQEWKYEWGGHKTKGHLPYKRLPFNCCAISFLPFEDAVCTQDGTCFDIVNIVPYVQQHHKHPVSGELLTLKDLIQLHWHKNADNEYHCPVLNKVFTSHTHIVAVKTTGNVYCYEALEELCIKPKNWKDLLDDTPFKRADIIHIQDPLNLSGKELENFDHVKKDIDTRPADDGESVNVSNVSEDTKRILAALGTAEASAAFAKGGGGTRAQALRSLVEAKAAPDREAAKKAAEAKAVGAPDPRLQGPARNPHAATFKPGASTWDTSDAAAAAEAARKKQKTSAYFGETKEEVDPNAGRTLPKPYAPKMVATAQSTGAASKGFTSTVMEISRKNELQMVVQYRTPKAKGYMRLHTNLGDLNIELHCNIAPRACENFMALAESGYYTGTKFHRSIKNFMIQGGDPTGTGKGGQSIYGPTFRDEFDSRLSHDGRGVLACANRGPHSNGSQFYFLFKSAPHLDNKHTVFGKVVGGMDVLTKMEKIETDKKDRPLEDIIITGATVFVNPYLKEAEEEAAAEAAAKEKKLKKEGDAPREMGQWFSNPAGGEGSKEGGVGRYLATAAATSAAKKPKTSTAASAFDAW